MAAECRFFPDRREEARNVRLANAARNLSTSMDQLLARLRNIDWRHPALVVYREDGDDRWSYVTIGLNTPEGPGEGE